MKRRISSFAWTVLAVAVICTTAVAAFFHFGRAAPQRSSSSSSSLRPPPTATPQQIEAYCGYCHAHPSPESFPRWAWKEEVEKTYKLLAQTQMDSKQRHMPSPPALDDVVRYYQQRAKPELPAAVFERAASPLPLRFERRSYPPPLELEKPAIANVNLVHLFDERRLDVLACDMRAGKVMALKPYESSPKWQILGSVPNPCHSEVVDLDGDGVKDILVANLGSEGPRDHSDGSVVWLRGQRGGGFRAHTLLEGVGRVADVQAADFRGIGRLDLIVAEFGWFRTGRILYLENQTADWSQPVFKPRQLDDRHGAIHVPTIDLNRDGRPDFVALISQEHETIVAFINQGEGAFRKETIYAAPDPAYGSSGIQLVDINGDGRVDVLYSNGDTMDPPYLLKSYHGIHWLENKGDLKFEHHLLTPMYGVHRAVAADFRGVRRLDIMAVSYLPQDRFPQRKQRNLDAVIYLEQTAPGQFARHSLETVNCDHPTCCAGDIFGDGRIDLVTGNLLFDRSDQAIAIWKNQGRASKTEPRP